MFLYEEKDLFFTSKALVLTENETLLKLPKEFYYNSLNYHTFWTSCDLTFFKFSEAQIFKVIIGWNQDQIEKHWEPIF